MSVLIPPFPFPPLFPLPLLLVSETTLIPQPQSLPLTKGEKEHQPKEQVQPPHLGSLLLPLPFARMVILPHLLLVLFPFPPPLPFSLPCLLLRLLVLLITYQVALLSCILPKGTAHD